MNDCITTTKQSTTKPCAYFVGYTVFYIRAFAINGCRAIIPVSRQDSFSSYHAHVQYKIPLLWLSSLQNLFSGGPPEPKSVICLHVPGNHVTRGL